MPLPFPFLSFASFTKDSLLVVPMNFWYDGFDLIFFNVSLPALTPSAVPPTAAPILIAVSAALVIFSVFGLNFVFCIPDTSLSVVLFKVGSGFGPIFLKRLNCLVFSRFFSLGSSGIFRSVVSTFFILSGPAFFTFLISVRTLSTGESYLEIFLDVY